jgi:hypothetical protein
MAQRPDLTLILARDVSGQHPGHGPGSRLERIRPGVFVPSSDWQKAYPEQRARAAAEALLLQSRGAPIVFAYATAAAYWGLPLFRTRIERVHVVQTHARAQSTRFVMRHADRTDAADIVWIEEGKVGVTSLARTTFDMIRTLQDEAAVALADSASRAVASAHTKRDLDLDAAEELREDIAGRISAAPGARGIRRARATGVFADARAESVGESVSRLYLDRLGFGSLDLQVRVPGPRGQNYDVDFDLGDAWGEFDGASKYTDPEFLRGRTPEQALADEKEREDWIRGTTRKAFGRWQFVHMPNANALGRRLVAFGIRPPATARPHLFREPTPD